MATVAWLSHTGWMPSPRAWRPNFDIRYTCWAGRWVVQWPCAGRGIYPLALRKLVLVASSPCFQQRDDWPVAMQREVLARFARELKTNYEVTLRRFIALQALGSSASREVLRGLQDKLFERGKRPSRCWAPVWSCCARWICATNCNIWICRRC